MNPPIRILHCFGRMNRGGSETLIMNIYRKIDRSVVQFDFVVHTTQECAFDKEIEALGGRIFRVPRYNVRNHLKYKRAWSLLFHQNKNEWEFVHAHMFTTAAIYLKIAKQYGIKTIVHSHNTSSGFGLNGLVKDIIQRPLKNNWVDYRFACSKTAGAWLFGNKNLPEVCILKNAIDAQVFAYNENIRNSMRRHLGIDNSFVIGHVGSFIESKNHMFLVDIFKEVQLRNHEAVLLLVGRGHMEEQVQDKVKRLGLENKVVFLGVRSDVAALMQAMDIFILPSHYEGLPVTVIEAQAAGLPCLLSDNITDEVKITGLVKFIPLGDLHQWVREILGLSSDFDRINTFFEIEKAGYDVGTATQWIQDFYTGREPNCPKL